MRFCYFFANVYNAATRYSSLEADEFDEGSAAEEADASVTQIAEVVASKGVGRDCFFGSKTYEINTIILEILENQQNQESWKKREAKCDAQECNGQGSILDPWWGF